MHLSVLPVFMYVQHMHAVPCHPEEGDGSPGTGWL